MDISSQADTAIAVQIGILKPELRLQVPAHEDSLPLVRQALRSVGETVQAEPEALEDAELAVTEACANAVEHAYGEEGGDVWIAFTPDETELVVSVADRGSGIDGLKPIDDTRGYGLPMIESIASRVEFPPTDGTDIRMAFPIGRPHVETVDGALPGVEPAERITRRLVAVVAAQQDMSTERVVEALLLAEVVARTALRYLLGEQAELRIEYVGSGFQLSVGPLEPGGSRAVVADSEVPVVGSVIEALANGIEVDVRDAGEYLILRVDPRG